MCVVCVLRCLLCFFPPLCVVRFGRSGSEVDASRSPHSSSIHPTHACRYQGMSLHAHTRTMVSCIIPLSLFVSLCVRSRVFFSLSPFAFLSSAAVLCGDGLTVDWQKEAKANRLTIGHAPQTHTHTAKQREGAEKKQGETKRMPLGSYELPSENYDGSRAQPNSSNEGRQAMSATSKELQSILDRYIDTILPVVDRLYYCKPMR